MPKTFTTSHGAATAAPLPAPPPAVPAHTVTDLAPGGRRTGGVYSKMRQEKRVLLLGITVVLGHARWMAAAAAGDAGPSPGTRVAAHRAAPRGRAAGGG